MFLRRIAALIGLFFGIVTSQLPEYAQQYRQRLMQGADDRKPKRAQEGGGDHGAA